MLQRNCCHLRLAIRWLKGNPSQDTERFTCSGCHQSYVHRGNEWVPISTAEDISDLLITHVKSLQRKDRP